MSDKDIPALVRNAAETEEDDNMSNDEHQKLNGGPNAACEDENENDADDDDDDNDDEWNELEPFSEPTKCLFCPDVEDTVQAAINHLNDRHGVNLCSILAKFNMDQYGYIKLINFIRTHNSDPTTIVNADKQLWSDDEYLKPVEVDSWLMFDIDEIKSILTKSNANNPKSEAHIIEDLQRQLNDKDAIIEHLTYQMEQMRNSYRFLIEQSDSNVNNKTVNSPLHKQMRLDQIQLQTHVAEVAPEDDEGYFSTYAHFDIHHDMLSDSVRTNSYRDAVLKNQNLFQGKTVLDVGCGTAILSMFVSKAGAKEVIAIDQSEIIYHAMDIASRNKIDNIKFVKGRIEDVKSPAVTEDKVDIIISEWMGYFLLFEGMLDSVIYARDHYLKPDGLLLPNRCNISLVGLGDEQRHKEYISFWNDVYGFDMAPMQSEVLKEAIVEVCRNDCVLTDPVVIAEFDVKTVSYTCPNFAFDFKLTVKKSGKITGFVGYFDTFFELPEEIHFTTGPHSKSTHWKQVIFYIRTPVEVAAGDVIEGKFQCRRGQTDIRALCIQIHVFNQTFNYSLN